MNARWKSTARVILILSLSAPASLARSEEIRLTDEPFLTTSLGASYRNWTLKKEGTEDVHVSELAVPLLVRKPLGDHADLSFFIPGVSAKIDGADGSHYRGLADAAVSGSYLIGGRTRFGLRLGLPSGRSDPDADERLIATIAANRILRFPVRRFGEGFDVGGSLVHGIPVGRAVVLSAGGGVLRKGEYSYAGSGGTEEKYDPGDEAYLACGAEGEWGRAPRVALAADLRYRMFGVDRRQGADFYEEGDEVDLFVDWSVFFTAGSRAAVRVFLAFKGDGSEEGAFGMGDIDSLATSRFLQRDLTGDYREVSVSYEHRVHRRVELTARGLFGDFGDYQAPGRAEGASLSGSARVYEAGAGFRLEITSRTRLLFDATRLVGEAEEGAVDLSGFDLATALRWMY